MSLKSYLSERHVIEFTTLCYIIGFVLLVWFFPVFAFVEWRVYSYYMEVLKCPP